MFNGHTHEQFTDLFHNIGEDAENRVVVLTGSGDAFMDRIEPDGFDFFTPRGYDKIFREGRKILMNILDIDVRASCHWHGVRRTCEALFAGDSIMAQRFRRPWQP